LADGPRHRDHLHIRRDLRQEIFGVKLVHRFLAIAAHHHRHRFDERVRYHCGDGLIDAVRLEFCAQMLVPNAVQRLFVGC
jgi:hypothetical protein